MKIIMQYPLGAFEVARWSLLFFNNLKVNSDIEKIIEPWTRIYKNVFIRSDEIYLAFWW